MKKYAVLPIADFNGSAGCKAPGEREERYRPYVEKQRLATPEPRMQEDNYAESD